MFNWISIPAQAVNLSNCDSFTINLSSLNKSFFLFAMNFIKFAIAKIQIIPIDNQSLPIFIKMYSMLKTLH